MAVETYAARRQEALQVARRELDAIRREQILDGFAATVLEKGYAATTVADIARGARVSKTTIYEHFIDKEDIYLHLHTTVAEALEAALVASVERTADEPDWRARVRHLVWTRLDVIASSRTFLAQPAVEPQIATASARDVRRSAARRNARVWVSLSQELAKATPDVAVIPEHVAFAGMAAGVALIGAVAPDGPDAIRALEDPLTDIWSRLFRAP
jgi:AcrR family transcriptional regulator